MSTAIEKTEIKTIKTLKDCTVYNLVLAHSKCQSSAATNSKKRNTHKNININWDSNWNQDLNTNSYWCKPGLSQRGLLGGGDSELGLECVVEILSAELTFSSPSQVHLNGAGEREAQNSGFLL